MGKDQGEERMVKWVAKAGRPREQYGRRTKENNGEQARERYRTKELEDRKGHK